MAAQDAGADVEADEMGTNLGLKELRAAANYVGEARTVAMAAGSSFAQSARRMPVIPTRETQP
ncbi:MAG: hypothetical protein AB7K71_35900 [Polyangiaceae bacterium]